LFTGLILAASPNVRAASWEDGRLQVVNFHVVAGGSWLSKTVKEMGTPEAVALISIACAAIAQTDCTSQAYQTALLARALQPIVVQGGPHEFGGAYRVPDGYRICRAMVNDMTKSMSGIGATFTGSLQDDRRQMAYYMFVRGGKQRDWINVNVYFEVLPEASMRADCMTDGPVFECGEKTKAGPNHCAEDQPNGYQLINDHLLD
jgi:hypothetical protein